MHPSEYAATKRKGILAVLLFLALALLAYNAVFSFSYSVGPNYRNVSIDTRVNITNAAPEIMAVTLSDPVTLSAGSTQLVECNVSVRDWNGYADINLTNATFYHSTSTAGAADDNNTHYANSSCAIAGQGGDYRNFTCGFYVEYYALNWTWTCNATTWDNSSYNDTTWNTTTVSGILALNVSPLIDYGDLAVGDTSANMTANVTNIGNIPINISVAGYGNVSGDGLAFVCDVGNITIDNEKFSADVAADYAAKTSLATAYQDFGFTIAKQDTPGVTKTNTTYWQLYVPPNPFGQCNGTVVFQAESP